MALTLKEVRRSVFGNRRVQVLDVTLDNSYPTGGLVLTPAALGMQEFDLVLVGTAAGYFFEFDYVNNKLKAINPRAAVTGTLAATVGSLAATAGSLAGTVPAGATAVTSSAVQPAIGITGAPTITGTPSLTGVAAVAAGPGAEVSNGTNLSAVTARLIAIGV